LEKEAGLHKAAVKPLKMWRSCLLKRVADIVNLSMSYDSSQYIDYFTGHAITFSAKILLEMVERYVCILYAMRSVQG
jgi:hypothetical protein